LLAELLALSRSADMQYHVVFIVLLAPLAHLSVASLLRNVHKEAIGHEETLKGVAGKVAQTSPTGAAKLPDAKQLTLQNATQASPSLGIGDIKRFADLLPFHPRGQQEVLMKTRCVNFVNNLLEKSAYSPIVVGDVLPACKWSKEECAALRDDLLKRINKVAPKAVSLSQSAQHQIGPRGPQPDFATTGGFDESIYGWCHVMYDMMRKKAIKEYDSKNSSRVLAPLAVRAKAAAKKAKRHTKKKAAKALNSAAGKKDGKKHSKKAKSAVVDSDNLSESASRQPESKAPQADVDIRSKKHEDSELLSSHIVRVIGQFIFGYLYWLLIVKHYPAYPTQFDKDAWESAVELHKVNEISALRLTSLPNCILSWCCTGPRAAHTFYSAIRLNYWAGCVMMTCLPCCTLFYVKSFSPLTEKLGGQRKHALMELVRALFCSCCVVAQDAESLDRITGVKTGFCGVTACYFKASPRESP